MVKYKAAIIGACAAVALAAAPLTPASAHSYHHGWPVFGLAALGAAAKRPLGVPCINDRALQRSTAQVLSAIMVCRCDRTKVRELGYFRRHEARADRAPVGEIYRDGQVCVTRRWRKADSNHRATRCRNSVALAVYLRNVGQG